MVMTCAGAMPAGSACPTVGGSTTGAAPPTCPACAGLADRPHDYAPTVRVAPEDHRFHPGVALVGYLVALSIALIGSLALIGIFGYADKKLDDFPLWLVLLSQVPQWAGLLGVTLFASRHWGTGRFRDDFGLRFRASDLAGVPIGVGLQLIFVPVLYWFLELVGLDISQLNKPAEQLSDKARGGFGVAMLMVLVVIGAPFVEELFFRGLVLRSFQAGHRDGLALVGSAVMFAVIHFQPLQFPGLLLFGLVAGYAAQRTRRLGLAMAIHLGFNLTAVIGLLIRS
jgi:uncharacterized protein